MSISAPNMLVITCYFLSPLFTVKLSFHFPEKTTCDRSAVSYVFDKV